MGIMMSKDEDNTELSQRITADLRNRSGYQTQYGDVDEDRRGKSTTKKTSKFGWVWIVLIVLALLSLAMIILY